MEKSHVQQSEPRIFRSLPFVVTLFILGIFLIGYWAIDHTKDLVLEVAQSYAKLSPEQIANIDLTLRFKFLLIDGLYTLFLIFILIGVWLALKRVFLVPLYVTLSNALQRHPFHQQFFRYLPSYPIHIHSLETLLRILQRVERFKERIDYFFPIGFALLDASGRVQFMHNAFADMLGSSPEAASGHLWTTLLSEESQKKIKESWHQAVSLHQKFQTRLLINNPDGLEQLYDVQMVPLLDEKRQLEGFIAIALPQDKIQEIQIQMHEEQERLNLMMRTAHMGLWSWELQETLPDLDRLVYQRLGYITAPQWSWEEYMHPKELELFYVLLKRHIENPERDLQLRCRLKHAHGQWCWFLIRGQVTKRDVLDTPIKIEGVLIDIDDQIKQEEQGKLLAELVNEASDAIFRVDLRGIILSWNRGATTLYGYPAEAIVGKGVDSITLDLAEIKRVILEKSPREFEQQCCLVGSAPQCISMMLAPILDLTGEVEGISVIARDITARKQAEAHDAYIRDLQAELISLVSHRLRTPVAVIKESLEELLPELSSSPQKIQKLAGLCQRSIQKISLLLHEVLDYEAFGRHTQVCLEKVDVNLFLRTITEGFQKSASDKQLQLSFQDYQPAVAIALDPQKIKPAIENLLRNAIQYTEEGEILVRWYSDPHAICIEIHDTGIGIPQEYHEKVFEPFYQIKKEYTGYGAGLGLTLARMLVETHGGTLQCDSKVQKGTCMLIRIPLERGGL